MARPLYTIFNLLALTAIIYTGVDLFYRVTCAQLGQIDTQKVTMQQIQELKNHKRPPLNDFKVIIERSIFGSPEEAPEGAKPTKIEALESTSLKIALLGTVSGDQQNAVAVIEETDKRKQGLYRVGDSVQNAIVKMILRGKVVLRVGDREEILNMKEASSSETEKGHVAKRSIGRERTITVNRSDLHKSMGDINRLLSQVRLRPHFKDGRADGLALTRIKAGSIFAKMGLRNGDIVQEINNRPINSPDDILSLYEKLRSGSQVSLQINRRGQQRTINYRFR